MSTERSIEIEASKLPREDLPSLTKETGRSRSYFPLATYLGLAVVSLRSDTSDLLREAHDNM